MAYAIALAVSLFTQQSAAAATRVRSDDEQRADESTALTEWLAQAGLDEILAAVLDDQVRKSTSSNPSAVARLSDAYIRLVGGASDEDRVADLRVRIEKFLNRNPGADQFKLRLAMGRADYRMALRGIERLRQGQIDKNDKARTAASLLHALQSFDQLADQLNKQLNVQALLAAGADEQQKIALASQVSDASDLLLGTRFLRTWCRYWLLWIDRPTVTAPLGASSPWPKQADEVVAAWSDLLETGKASPEPMDCSVDLLSEEYYAQSILGMALSKSLQSNFSVGDGWFKLLQQPGVWSGLVDFAPWYLQALVDCGEYKGARNFLNRNAEQLNCPAVVGAAIRAVEESANSLDAIELAKAAVEVAAIQSDFASVGRIARRVPSLAQGTGFAACLARGIDWYDQGRIATDSKLKKACLERASTELLSAIAAASLQQGMPGMPGMPVTPITPITPIMHGRPSTAAVQELLGWSQLGSGHACEAAESFVLAANQLSGTRADEALWMAAESLSQGGCPNALSGKDARGFVLAREYLARFESGNHAASAAAILAKAPDAEKDSVLVDRLLRDAMRAEASSFERESAASLLYKRFRAAAGADRASEAGRLLSVPLRRIGDWSSGSIDIVARQQLECALDPAVLQVKRAVELLAIIESKYPIGQEPMEFRCELATRRLVVAFAKQDFPAALDAIATVRSVADEQWRPVAEAIFVRGMESMIAQRLVSPQQVAQGRVELVAARRALRDRARTVADVQRADAADIQLGLALLSAAHAIRANAAEQIPAPKGADPQAMAKEALSIARGILANRPDDAQAFGLMADAGMACGDFDAAHEALSRLVGALSNRSDAWFERKADLCDQLMSASKVDEVRKILTQHVVLVPDWGPGIGGARLKALAERLGVVGTAVPQSPSQKKP